MAARPQPGAGSSEETDMTTRYSSSGTICCLLATALVALMGCNEKSNSNYCPGRNPNDNCSEPPATSACTGKGDCAPPLGACNLVTGMCVQCGANNDCGVPLPACDLATNMCVQCVASSDCAAPTAACDTASQTCVQCTPTETAGCTGTTPVCGSRNACQACTSHADCTASNVCLADGSCAAVDKVAYVAAPPAGTVNPTCGIAAPCSTVAAALLTGRPYVKFRGTIDEAVVVENGRVVTFVADPGAKLTHGSGDPILTVRGDGTTLDVFDLSISDGPNSASGFGLLIPAAAGSPKVSLTRVLLANDPAGGVSTAGGTLSISQSTIRGNAGGGVSITGGTFNIVGNVFFNNGNGTVVAGGLTISTSQNAANRLDFNSFALNEAQPGVGAAIHCIAGTFTARNNIMSDNGTLANMEQISGACLHAYSIVRPGSLPPGTGNKADDPRFKNASMGDLHIQPGSPAIGGADPTSVLSGPAARDIDGDARSLPADIGADEIL
jgi:hypothetical protein